jgi:glycosyltransferase involved in cell wall biosynthesis
VIAIRVLFYADFVGKTGDYHPIAKEVLKYPPRGVHFVRSKFRRGIFNRIISRIVPQKVIRMLPEKNFKLIFSVNFLIKNKTNWIIWDELLHPTFAYYGKEMRRLYLSEFCRKVLPWSEKAKETILEKIPELKNKIEVVYPAIHKFKIKKIRKQENIPNILFIGRDFARKGGPELLEAYRILRDKYDVTMTMITNLPIRLEPIPGLRVVPETSRQMILNKYFPTADIFVLPSYSEALPMVLIEAMYFGIPIVATDAFAIPEVVEDGKTGFIIKLPKICSRENFIKRIHSPEIRCKEIVEQLVANLSTLIEDTNLRRKFGRTARNEVLKGKFSIKKRNKKLKTIFEEALRQ